MKKTIKRVQIALHFGKMKIDTLLNFSLGIVNGIADDPDATAPPISSDALGTQRSALQTTHASRQTDKSKDLTNLEHDQATTLVTSLTKIAHYVEDLANDKAAGDTAIATQIITRIGFQVKKGFVRHQRSFEIVSVDKGSVHLHTSSAGQKAAYLWQYSATLTNSAGWSFPIHTLKSEVVITGLQSGINYGFRFASIIPAKGKSTVTAGNEQPVWSDVITSVVL